MIKAALIAQLVEFYYSYKIAADWEQMARASEIYGVDIISTKLNVLYLDSLSTYSRQIGNQELLRIRKTQIFKILE